MEENPYTPDIHAGQWWLVTLRLDVPDGFHSFFTRIVDVVLVHLQSGCGTTQLGVLQPTQTNISSLFEGRGNDIDIFESNVAVEYSKSVEFFESA